MATELSPELLVTQSNRLIESAHTMSVGEKRLLMAAAALMDSRKPSAGTVSFHARQFAEVFATDLDHAYEIVRDAAKRLFNRSIREIVDDPAAKRRKGGRAAQTIRDTRWVSQAEYAEGQGVITLTFTDKVLPYLTLLHREFTSYRLKHVGRLSTFYALRMYELLSQYRVTAERTCDLAQLRQMLDLGDKYPRVNSFRQRVLDPSIQEINQVTDLLVTVTPITQGRAVTGFHFAIVTNPQLKLDLHEPLEPISADDAESDKYEQQAQQRLE